MRLNSSMLFSGVIFTALAFGAILSVKHSHAQELGEPIATWDREKDGGSLLDGIRNMANLPKGEHGQTVESLKAEIVEARGRVVSESDSELLARGRTATGVEVEINVPYKLSNGRFVEGGEIELRGSPID